MTNKQKAAILIGLFFIVLMGLFPPRKIYQGPEVIFDYIFIFKEVSRSNIDLSLLLVQWLCVCIIMGGVVWMLKK